MCGLTAISATGFERVRRRVLGTPSPRGRAPDPCDGRRAVPIGLDGRTRRGCAAHDPWTAGCLPSFMVATPAIPSTVTRSPSRSRRVAAPVASTAGMPSAAVGHDSTGLDEQHRPCWGRDWADEDVSGTLLRELGFVADESDRSGVAAGGAGDSRQLPLAGTSLLGWEDQVHQAEGGRVDDPDG